jgi:hypothetical protein
MHDKAHPVEEALPIDDTRRIRRYVDDVVTRIATAAARRRGNDDVLSVIRTVPDPDHLDEPVNSL